MWLNGRVLEPGEGAVASLDHGVSVGDGVFETLKVVGCTPFAFTRHLARLRPPPVAHAHAGLVSLPRLYPSRRQRHRHQWPQCSDGNLNRFTNCLGGPHPPAFSECREPRGWNDGCCLCSAGDTFRKLS